MHSDCMAWLTTSIEYTAPLSDEDRLRVRIRHRRGRLTDIMVQLECLISGEWLPAVRYDTHAGFHRHTAPWDRSIDRRVRMETADLAGALNRAIDDRKAEWPRYRAACAADEGR